MAAKTEVWAENPVEGYARVLPRRISNPLKDINVEIGVSKRLAPGKSMVKSASWSDFGGAAAASKVAVVDARVSAASKKVTAEVVVAEAGAARANNKSAAEAPANTKPVATEARANKKSAAEARANKKATKKANKAAAAAEAAAEKPYPFPIPSEEYFNLWEDPKDREEIRASFTRIAELFAQ